MRAPNCLLSQEPPDSLQTPSDSLLTQTPQLRHAPRLHPLRDLRQRHRSLQDPPPRPIRPTPEKRLPNLLCRPNPLTRDPRHNISTIHHLLTITVHILRNDPRPVKSLLRPLTPQHIVHLRPCQLGVCWSDDDQDDAVAKTSGDEGWEKEF